MDLRQFFQTVVTAPEPGWFGLWTMPQQGHAWWEEWYRWPDDIEKILDKAFTVAEDCNVYFSTYLFREPSSTKENVLPTRTIQADLDEADILKLSLPPTILVQTSPGRHQGYWVLKEKWIEVEVDGSKKLLLDPPLHPEAHEILSRKLTYSIEDCDTSGWPLGRKVRVPWTFNWKYLEGPQHIQVVTSTLKQYGEEELELLDDPPPKSITGPQLEFLDGFGPTDADDIENKVGIGPQELLNKLSLPSSVKSQYNVSSGDRSKALWALCCAAFKAGCTREQVWWLGWHSANNKFKDLKFHAERELAKDVLRAEEAVRSKGSNSRDEVAGARRLPGMQHEKRQQILQIVLNHLKSSGEFIHTSDDLSWYIRSDLGRPILVTPHSEWLDMILDLQFGLNSTETDKQYVSHGLNNFCRSLPVNGIQASLSFYDQSNRALLIHTGRKEIIRITTDDISRGTDGSYGIVFPWGISNEPFTPQFGSTEVDWSDILFSSAVGNVVGLAPELSSSLLRVWLLFLLFRSAAISRPIIAFFGQPGAGKSTLFRRIYTLLYGRQRSVTGVTTPESFDQAVASDPFVVLDNVDQPEKWLPDRLAMAASTSEIPKRKLYTDADPFILRRQALLGITAHNPQFSREDVADRLLLLTFERLKNFLPEGDILQNIHNQRNKLWGQIVLDCQKVLRTPLPTYADVPQFRVEDFARIGYWIAAALGCGTQFSEALSKVGKGQRSLNLDQDHILVQTLQIYVKSGKGKEWRTAGQLWSELQIVAPDQHSFGRVYRNAVHLGKKLWSLQDSLKEIFEIEWAEDSAKGSRVWRITPFGERLNGST